MTEKDISNKPQKKLTIEKRDIWASIKCGFTLKRIITAVTQYK